MISLPFTSGRSVKGTVRRNSGFTLIEMLTVTSITAVLLVIGIPSFKYVTQSNRSSSEINGLLGDMQFARAEAIREGQTVTVCPSTDGLNCKLTTSWQTGWIVFSDTGVIGTVDGTDQILKMQRAFTSQDALASDNAVQLVTFSRDGFALGLPSPITVTLHDSTLNARFTRCLSLTIVGGLSTQIGGTLTAENTTC
jgi:type IV fimbrial biogenesis protein FimT